MVIDLKKIGAVFLVLAIAQLSLWFYFNAQIAKGSAELNSKREVLTKLTTLEDKWSLKNQTEELKRVYDFLDAFDVYYTKKKRKKREVLTMDLKAENLNKVTSFLLNRKIDFKKLNIKKIDSYNIKLSVEI